ncbi:MAG: PDR/VanB family oxidoreductase [Xanthobacteraceae bacterium]
MRYAPIWTDAVVRAIRDETPTVRSFEIVPTSGNILHYEPGAHIEVKVLVAGLPQTRSYSLVGETQPDHYRIAVKRRADSTGGSIYMGSLQPGARLAITEPRTSFAIDYDRPDYLLVAGGIGITPIVGMAQVLARRGARVRLLYAAHTRGELAFAGVLNASLGDRLECLVSTEGRRIDLAAAFASLLPGALCALCGPMPMLDDARRLWVAAGRPLSDLRWETFGSSGALPAEDFTVAVPRHGVEIVVPRNRTLLDTLADAGIEVISDCRKGECGLCALTVMQFDGRIDHRDVFLSDEQKAENQKICACVSRAAGRIVIDTDYRPDAI